MAPTIIALIFFLGSFGGLVYIIGRKLPRVLAVSAQEKEGLVKFLRKQVRRKLQNSEVSKFVDSPDLFLQTLLSKARILALRLESKTNDWLVKLRKRSQEKNGKFSQRYWDKFKKK